MRLLDVGPINARPLWNFLHSEHLTRIALPAATAANTARAHRLRFPGLLHPQDLQQQQQHKQQQQHMQQQQRRTSTVTFASCATAGRCNARNTEDSSKEPPTGSPVEFSSVEVPSYVRQLKLGHWTLYFYPIPQYLKSTDGAPTRATPEVSEGPRAPPFNAQFGGSSWGPSAWEGASLVAALQPQLLCLECCNSRLQQLAAAATAAIAAAADGGSMEEEIRKQQRRLARGFSLLTSFDGGNAP